MPGYRHIGRPQRPATLAELATLTPSESLALARTSVQRTPRRPRITLRRYLARTFGPPALFAGILAFGYLVPSWLTGGAPF